MYKWAVAASVLLALFSGDSASAMCAQPPGKLVRAKLLRCESPEPYLQSAAASKGLEFYESKSPSQQRPATIIVVQVEQELHPESHHGWQNVHEHARYWWSGSQEVCESGGRRVVELWVHATCCDTLPPYGACLADLDCAQPVPDEIRSRLSGLLSARPASRR